MTKRKVKQRKHALGDHSCINDVRDIFADLVTGCDKWKKSFSFFGANHNVMTTITTNTFLLHYWRFFCCLLKSRPKFCKLLKESDSTKSRPEGHVVSDVATQLGHQSAGTQPTLACSCDTLPIKIVSKPTGDSLLTPSLHSE